MPTAGSRLLAFDLRTGKELWKDSDVFGTWLSYSVEHDILIEAGRVARDTISDEPKGMRAYRGATGRVLWFESKHSGPAMIHGDTILMNSNASDLMTGRIKTRQDPLTLETVDWVWSRNYGSPHMSPSEPTKAGHDVVELQGVGFPNQERTLQLRLEKELQPVHQLRIRLDLRAADGTPVRQTVYLTINGV